MCPPERNPLVEPTASAPAARPGLGETIPRLLLTRTPLGFLVRRVAGLPASVHGKLLGAFLLVVLLLIALGATSLQMIAGVARQSALLDQARERVDASRQMEQAVGVQMTFTRNALLLRDDATIESILRDKGRFDDTLRRLEDAASPGERETIQRIRAAQDRVMATVGRIAGLIREGQHDDALTLHLNEGSPLHREIGTLVTRVVQNEEAGMARLRQSVAAANRQARLLVGGFAAGSIALALVLGFVTSWSFILPLRRAETFLGQVARGDFRASIDVPNRDEFGALAGWMNQTSRELHQLSEDQRRLVEELEGRNRELTEALAQQTATSEVLKVISRSTFDLQVVLQTVVESAVQLSAGDKGFIYRRQEDLYHVVAAHGASRDFIDLVRSLPIRVDRGSATGRAVLERQTVHIHDVLADPEYTWGTRQITDEVRTILAAPMLREGSVIGVIVIRRARVEPFTNKQIDLVRAFADQAVIAIENVRLFTALEAKNRELTDTLEQQTATSEILGAISGSPTDAQPVFDTIARNAVRLCQAAFAYVFRFDGTLMHVVAHHNLTPAALAALERQWPMRPDSRSVPARAVLERRVVHVADVLDEPDHPYLATSRALGIRTMLTVPMLREGQAIGAIAVYRQEVAPFSEQQIRLVATFASQAVIAVENVRLFTELQSRNGALIEALERQTATSEVLKVISRSAFDLQPVLEVLAENATRLCAAAWALVYRLDGEVLRVVAHHGAPAQLLAWFSTGGQGLELRAGRASVTGRAAATGRTVHLSDVLTDPEYAEFDAQRHGGFRAALGVPMLRDGHLLGVFFLARSEPTAFTDEQIALVTTFADQAVIAIENVRLFQELEARNRDLTDTLEQQTATGEILRAISRSPTDVQPVFDTIVQSAVRLCDGLFGVAFRFDGELMHLVAHHNYPPDVLQGLQAMMPMRLDGRLASARAIQTRAVVHIPDAPSDADYPHHLARVGGILAVPMLRDGSPIGVIAVDRARPGPFSASQIDLLRTFADQAVIAIENVRLFTELEARNRDLTETLDQQTATSEILRVISGSPTDVQPVFDTIVRSAVRLCDGLYGAVCMFDGEMILRPAATHNYTAAAMAAVQRVYPRPPDRQQLIGRAILSRAVAHLPDVLDDPDYSPEVAQAGGWRSAVATPMLREGQPTGAILVTRAQAGPFSDRHIALLQTFADQAVIAIENVRLFQALEARNRDLTETLEQQTATSEILRVISSSPTDTQPVFETIARRAMRLCDAEFAAVFRFDGQLLHFAAHHGLTVEAVDATRQAFPTVADLGSAAGRSVLAAAVVQIPDVHADPQYRFGALASIATYRSIVAVPLVRDGVPLGTITVRRVKAGAFPAGQIEIIKTFADQAVIAIENVRLFTALEARNSELRGALDQQTATSELLKVIGRSTFDLQPVFEALAENAVRLCAAEQAVVFRFDGQHLRAVVTHNITRGNKDFVEQNPIAPGRGSGAGRAALERRTIHIQDVRTDPEYTYGAGQLPFRTLLAIPMLRADELLGTISIHRDHVLPFTDSQVALMETFADQAAIAIENARLLNELQERTTQLTRSVLELQALGEVSQAVGSTLDLEAVLETIVSRAVQLSGSYSGIVYEFDEASRVFHARATHRITPDYLGVLRAAPIRLGEGAMGRAGVSREPVQVADVEGERQLVAPQVRDLLVRQGLGSLLALPLVRENRLLGGLVILRQERGAFSPETVDTLRTFATQSVLAIHNARLFREIQRQKQYSEALVETSPVAIVTLDLGGAVVGWNPGAERLFGYTPAEAVGRLMEDLVAGPEARDEVRANIRQTLAGEWIRAIGRRARKDGSPVDVEISSMPIVVDGARMGMIGIYHDITELLRARREAEAANEAKSAFLATMSHEIRTPLNAVIGMSGLLLNTPLTDEQREYAEVVRQSGDALLTVINDVLDFSKIEAGKLDLESQPFDLRECVEGALDLVAGRAAEKGLDLAYLVGEGAPAALVGDLTRLRQVLLNLLSNAVKFTERGEVVLTVEARPVDGPAPLHELTFTVRDTGIGIPPDRLDRLFQSFSQVDASTTRRYGGSGLGLAISRRLVELMGGRIGVESEPGHGSEFRFTIRAPAAREGARARRDLGGVQPSLRGKRVLVVDDNATNRRIVTAHLDAWGLLTRATGSPREALAWIQAGQPFDAGILDMHMPDMDGVGLARAVREARGPAAPPLILFTSLGRREARAESEGFAAYLHKPIKPSQLFDALVSVLAEQTGPGPDRAGTRSEFDPDLGRRHPLRILLAEDNVVNQKVALRLLGQMGYRADVAANGLEAIEAVARQAYDVVLMDVQMPELDGFEASREINRRWPVGRRPRLVAMTANALQGDRELCMAAGMDDYVAKPIRVEELVAALGRCTPRPAGGATDWPAPAAGPAADPAPPDPPAPAIDRAVFDRLVATMGGAFVAELVDTFVEDTRELIGTLRQALATGDLDAFRRAAHSLKSNGETLGATGLAALARELEALARAGHLEGAGPQVDQLAAASDPVIHTLGELRRDLPA